MLILLDIAVVKLFLKDNFMEITNTNQLKQGDIFLWEDKEIKVLEILNDSHCKCENVTTGHIHNIFHVVNGRVPCYFFKRNNKHTDLKNNEYIIILNQEEVDALFLISGKIDGPDDSILRTLFNKVWDDFKRIISKNVFDRWNDKSDYCMIDSSLHSFSK